jgi:hypothetical protein
MGLNPGRRGGKPATNRLSYGAALRSAFKNTPENNRDLTARNVDIVTAPKSQLSVAVISSYRTTRQISRFHFISS